MEVRLDEAHRAIDSEASRRSGGEAKRCASEIRADDPAAGPCEVEAHLPGSATHLDDRGVAGDGAIEHAREFTPLRPGPQPLHTVARRVRGKRRMLVELTDAVRWRVHRRPEIGDAIRLAEPPHARLTTPLGGERVSTLGADEEIIEVH